MQPYEHYLEAERLLEMRSGDPNLLAEAQVHATLALAPEHLMACSEKNARKDLVRVDVEPKATRGLMWGALLSSLIWIFLVLFLVKAF